MSLMELKFFAEVLGYSDLINLDGGGSSTLYVKGQGTNGVVNVPSDGKERPVKSIIYFSFKQE
jgi:exopolysaccharide biosynthesis protein